MAVVCLPPSYFGQALPLWTVDEGRKYFALKTPHARARAIRDVGKLRGAILELWLDIPGPQIMRLLHVNVAVHDLEALLHGAILLSSALFCCSMILHCASFDF